MQLRTYVNFEGTCEEAFTFYAALMGGKIEMLMRWRDMPGGNVPPGHENKVMHAQLRLGDGLLLAADSPPGRHSKPQGFNVNVEAATPAEAERIFAGLSEGGQITMPISETFFAKRFGMVTDRFGVPWMVMAS